MSIPAPSGAQPSGSTRSDAGTPAADAPAAVSTDDAPHTGDATAPADGSLRRPAGRHAGAGPGWPLWVTHLVLPVGLVALFLLGAGVHRLGGREHGWGAVVGVCVLAALITVAVARRLPARAAGVAAWGGVAAAIGIVVTRRAGPAMVDVQGVLAGFVLVAIVGGLVLLRWRPEQGDRSVRARLRLLGDGAFRPPRAWAAWIVGGGLAAPLAALYAPIILDVDSAWVVIATQGYRDQGIRFLQETQDVVLPQVVLGPILRTWGYQGAIIYSIGTVAVLAALASVTAYHLTRRPVASFVAGGALLAMPSIVPGAYRLPMYATMLILGYAGALLVHSAMGSWPHRWWLAAAGGVALALAPEAHSLGQLFLLVPFLLVVLHPHRRVVRALLVSVLAMAITSIPRVWLNLSIGGFHQFRSNRTDWLVEKGYLRMINERLRHQRSNDGPVAYLGNVPHLLEAAFGVSLLVVLGVLVAVAAIRAQRRTLVFVVVVVVAFILALVVAAPGTYGRYLSPLGVGAAIVAGCGAAALADADWLGRWRAQGRALAAVAVVVVVLLAAIQIGTNVRSHQGEVRRLSPYLTSLADRIPPGEGVMGVRSNLMVYVNPNLHTLYGRTMSEKDFVTYLTWPSDKAVIRMMRRLGVTWVVVRDSKFAETTYHETWLRPVYGKRDRHAHEINQSDRFCREARVGHTVLYRIGGCAGGT